MRQHGLNPISFQILAGVDCFIRIGVELQDAKKKKMIVMLTTAASTNKFLTTSIYFGHNCFSFS